MVEEHLQRVVIHYQDRKILKGFLYPFQITDEETVFSKEEKPTSPTLKIPLKDLKAIYYVKDHLGNKNFKERKKFGLAPSKGRKIMVKFKDRELLCGYVTETLPWVLGKYHPESDSSRFGFFSDSSRPRKQQHKNLYCSIRAQRNSGILVELK